QRLSREMKPCVCLCILNIHLPCQMNRLGADTHRGLDILHFLVNPGKSNSQTRGEVALAIKFGKADRRLQNISCLRELAPVGQSHSPDPVALQNVEGNTEFPSLF